MRTPFHPRARPAPTLRERLLDPAPLLGLELRPPRKDLDGVRAMDAWIDVYHAVRGLASADTVVFLTDNAVGTGEEENVGHLLRNLGPRAPLDRILPILTLKHSLDYCLWYASRASQAGFPGLVILGGDPQAGAPRCLPRAWMLRERLRRECPGLLLGGWVNPRRPPEEQVGHLVDHRDSMDFALTQIVSHHDLDPIARFLEEGARRAVDLPLIAGVFFYRSGHAPTLSRLKAFMPVPEEELQRDFHERGLAPEEVASETLRRLRGLGISRFYLSNVETARAVGRLGTLAAACGMPSPLGPRSIRSTGAPPTNPVS